MKEFRLSGEAWNFNGTMIEIENVLKEIYI